MCAMSLYYKRNGTKPAKDRSIQGQCLLSALLNSFSNEHKKPCFSLLKKKIQRNITFTKIQEKYIQKHI